MPKRASTTNNITISHPDMAAQWHPSKNGGLKPENFTYGSHQRIWWICKLGHEWDATILSRRTGNGCPYCGRKRPLKGYSDLATLHPEVASEWHPTKNQKAPEEYAAKSNERVWWQCALGHEWLTPVSSRTFNNTGCPYCARRKILPGFNDLATVASAVLELWHPTKNLPVTPQDVMPGTREKVWWQCSEGHEWYANVKDCVYGHGCPKCSGRDVIAGVTDLSTTHPQVAALWHPEKNNEMTAADVSAGSHHRAWWLCEKGHSWQMGVYHHALMRQGCSVCSMVFRSSQKERDVFQFVESLGVSPKANARLGRVEVDILVEDLNVAVEFNGIYWHAEEQGKGPKYHWNKWQVCKERGIQLIQIWEDDWDLRQELVKRMLAYKLGVGDVATRVPARKTKVKVLTKEEASQFLTENHIQGHVASSYYLGLTDTSGSLVAVMSLKKEDGGRVLHIARYATDRLVAGGFTKLLKYAERTFTPEQVVTFSDHCVSDGGLYENNGFVAEKELPADYMYVDKTQRHHKFGYRLKRFRNDPNLKWVEGLTERELAQLNKLNRIWDAGKTRWVKTITDADASSAGKVVSHDDGEKATDG